MNALPDVVTAEQLADALGPAFDKRAIYRLHAAGLPRIQINRRVVYDVEAVRQWLESRRVGDYPAATDSRVHLRRVV